MARKGRPPWVPPDLNEVRKLAERGLTYEQIAAAMRIHVATLHKKKRELADFNDALEKGRATGIGNVANALFEAAMRGEHAPMIFYLKSRAGWWDQGPTVEINQTLNPAPGISGSLEPAVLESRVQLLRERDRVLRELGVPVAIDLPESEFKALPEPAVVLESLAVPHPLGHSSRFDLNHDARLEETRDTEERAYGLASRLCKDRHFASFRHRNRRHL